MAQPSNWTAIKKRKFLDFLRATGNVSASCRAVGLSRKSAYALRRRDDEFREAWESAVEESLDDLEAELRRRAIEGTEKPVYYGGKQCGAVKTYSDRLGMFLLKGRRFRVFGEGAAKGRSGGEAFIPPASPRQRLLEKLGAMEKTRAKP